MLKDVTTKDSLDRLLGLDKYISCISSDHFHTLLLQPITQL